MNLVLAVTGFIVVLGLVFPDRGMYEPTAVDIVIVVLMRGVQRTSLLSGTLNALAIPSHEERLRRAQIGLLLLCTAPPILLGARFGLDTRMLAVFLGAAGGCVAIAMFPWLAWLFLAIFLPSHLKHGLASLALSTPGVLFIIGASFAVCWHWVRRPSQAVFVNQGLSGDPSPAPLLPQPIEDGQLGPALRPAHLSASRFWLGLGHTADPWWKCCLAGVGLGLGMFVIAHFWNAGRTDATLYLVSSAMIGILLFGRFAAMNQAWTQTPGEQSVLLLTPEWPQGNQLKRAMMLTTLPGICGYLLSWAILSAVALLLGWVSPVRVAIGGIALAAMTLGMLGLFMCYLAHARMRRRMYLPMIYLLAAFIGLVMLVFGLDERNVRSLWFAALLTLLPFALSLLAFCLRRPQFPARPWMGRS